MNYTTAIKAARKARCTYYETIEPAWNSNILRSSLPRLEIKDHFCYGQFYSKIDGGLFFYSYFFFFFLSFFLFSYFVGKTTLPRNFAPLRKSITNNWLSPLVSDNFFFFHFSPVFRHRFHVTG